MDDFPVVKISGEGRMQRLTRLFERIENLIPGPNDQFGKNADEYLIDGLKIFDLVAYAGHENNTEYNFIPNEFWNDELVALAVMSVRGDFTNLHCDTLIPKQLHGKMIFLSENDVECFFRKIEKLFSQTVRNRKPRYGKVLSEMAFAIVNSKGPLSDAFTKADIKREMRPALLRFANIPVQSTIDSAVDKAIMRWEKVQRARLPKSGKSGKSES